MSGTYSDQGHYQAQPGPVYHDLDYAPFPPQQHRYHPHPELRIPLSHEAGPSNIDAHHRNPLRFPHDESGRMMLNFAGGTQDAGLLLPVSLESAPYQSSPSSVGADDDESRQQQHRRQHLPPNPHSYEPQSSSGEGSKTSAGKGKEAQRKQNVACDACRSRKVKCVRTNGSDKCDSCNVKSLVCTAHYVSAIASKDKKKDQKAAKDGPSTEDKPKAKRSRQSDTQPSRSSTESTSHQPPPDHTHPSTNIPLYSSAQIVPSCHPALPPSLFSQPLYPSSIYQHTFPIPPLPPPPRPSFPPSMHTLIQYLFSPTEVLDHSLGYSDGFISEDDSFRGHPSLAHRELLDHAKRMELANDLIETFFQIVHIRMPLLSPDKFKSQFQSSSSFSQPAHVLIAVVLAWGAKFSKNDIIVRDRNEFVSHNQTHGRRTTRSRLGQMLVIRAQEVLDKNKSARIASLDNVHANLLLEPILCHSFPIQRGSPAAVTRTFWITTAVSSLLTLQMNKKSTVVKILDEQERGSVVFSFWFACLSDAHASLYFRTMPVLHSDDYNLEPPPAWTAGQDITTPHPLGTLSEYMVWYIASHQLASAARRFCRVLWLPSSEAEGIPLAELRILVDLSLKWRDEHLELVGVPADWPATWDFVAAVTACSSDSNYHVMWLILHRAIEEFGVRENRVAVRTGQPLLEEAVALQQQVSQEALHGALRISALCNVLASNDYLKLDPNVLQYSLLEAGLLLATLGRVEVEPCLEGLLQYGEAFEECFKHVDEITRIYNDARSTSTEVPVDVKPAVGLGSSSTFYPQTPPTSSSDFAPSASVPADHHHLYPVHYTHPSQSAVHGSIHNDSRMATSYFSSSSFQPILLPSIHSDPPLSSYSAYGDTHGP